MHCGNDRMLSNAKARICVTRLGTGATNESYRTAAEGHAQRNRNPQTHEEPLPARACAGRARRRIGAVAHERRGDSALSREPRGLDTEAARAHPFREDGSAGGRRSGSVFRRRAAIASNSARGANTAGAAGGHARSVDQAGGGRSGGEKGAERLVSHRVVKRGGAMLPECERVVGKRAGELKIRI